MDFLPLPDGVASHVAVPNLGGAQYDNQGFRGYDRRQGWNSDALRRGDVDASREDWEDYEKSTLQDLNVRCSQQTSQGRRHVLAGAFIQTWILFGIFHEALHRAVYRPEACDYLTCSEFYDAFGTSSIMTVKSLFGEFMGTKDSLQKSPTRAQSFTGCLREAASILSDLDRHALSRDGYLVPPSVYQALAVLVGTLGEFTRRFCPWDVDDHFLVPMRHLETHLESRGWCPNLTYRLGQRIDIGGLYYASLLPGLVAGQVHDQCRDEVCVAANIDPTKYSTRHVAEHCMCQVHQYDHDHEHDHVQSQCSCHSVVMPEADLSAAFEDGGYPLIRVRGDHVEVVRQLPGKEPNYIAISHVWSDGRGNPDFNGLPLCQLRSIHQYVFSMHGDSLFWIDTLCVPLQEPLRNTAIVRMARVYMKARCVLVLSADLLSIQLPSTPDEALLRIFCSTWNTRLWTLQEAALAKELAFQFSDQAIRYRSLVNQADDIFKGATDQSHLGANWAAFYLDQIISIRRSKWADWESAFGYFWACLHSRSTSRPLDAVICGSILLGLQVSKVVVAPEHCKTQTFWRSLKAVPASILWVHGPRLKDDGFRWAPSRLMPRITGSGLIRGIPMAEISHDGLRFGGVEAVCLEGFDTSISTQRPAHFRFGLTASPSSRKFLVWNVPILDEDLVGSSSPGYGRWVLLFSQLPGRSREEAALAVPLSPIDYDECAEAPIWARYLAFVHIMTEAGESSKDDEPDLLTPHIIDIPQAQRLPNSQRWCIL